MTPYIILFFIAVIVIYLLFINKTTPESIIIPSSWKEVLTLNVHFYRQLTEIDKGRFENDCFLFLSTVKINGVKGVHVDLKDRLLVASSAVIPIFGFPEWTYKTINEVLLYPAAFDRSFSLNNPDEIITGMVGSGIMENKMILSKPALLYGFENNNDKENVGIHEFVHLFDKEDGLIDGIPSGFETMTFSLPWMDLVKVKIIEIEKGKSEIKPYGATNHEEFFSVVSEYFFESPHLLKKKHPVLYEKLVQVFRQDLTVTYDKKNIKNRTKPGRNEKCICGSGLKYKKCCAI